MFVDPDRFTAFFFWIFPLEAWWFRIVLCFEPTPEALANEVIPMILDMIFYDILLESKASEHSARMIAMKNAKDSADKIAGRLTLQYNKARQAIITREVSEITAGVESMKDV